MGSDDLLDTEALQSCLPHQLDLWTGQLWVEGRSTLQLHQQRLTPSAVAFLTTSVVLPPDSKIVAPVSVQSASGVRPGPCLLVKPCMGLMEDYGVIVGHTLVDASSWSPGVLMVNPNAEEIVLPSFTCVGNLVLVSAVLVALAEPCQIIWKTLPQGLTLLWGRLVDCCSGTFSIGMCFRHPGNLSQDILRRYSMRS